MSYGSDVNYILLSFLYISRYILFIFFFFNDTATTEIYTLSLHDALPIYFCVLSFQRILGSRMFRDAKQGRLPRSEEHTSELQSRLHLVCRLLLEKKKNKSWHDIIHPAELRHDDKSVAKQHPEPLPEPYDL